MEQTSKIELLDNSSKLDNIQMPSDEFGKNMDKAMYSKDITKAISGNAVETYLVDESNDIEVPNYMFNLVNKGSMSRIYLKIIKGLLSENGNVAIYLCNGKSVIKAGYGDDIKINSIISTIKSYIFNDDIQIYKNIERGKKLEEVKKRDITKLRMKL